jgi:hypothetical protein
LVIYKKTLLRNYRTIRLRIKVSVPKSDEILRYDLLMGYTEKLTGQPGVQI